MKLIFKNTAYIFLLLVAVSILSAPKTLASTLQLSKIGALDIGGKFYNEWWYTGANPALVGKATANTDVSVKIDETAGTAKANGTGDWSFNTTLTTGDHKIVITQGAENITFTLHEGQPLPANIGGTTNQATVASKTPVTGFNQIVALSFGLGVILLASYLYIWGDSKRKSVFEAKILKD